MGESNEMVILDTTFIIRFLKNKQNAVEKMQQISRALYTTQLNVFEVLIGIHRKGQAQEEMALSTFNIFLSKISILELDKKSTEIAAKICAELDKTGKTVQHKDVLIAAIALANGENSIVTQNVKDFIKIPRIKVERY